MFGKQVGKLGATPRSPLQRAISALKALYATGVQGAWYDPSDFTTLFQDSAGTTPVTAVEQSVGRMLDKSGRGNHATQPTAINRPVLSARVNLFLDSNNADSSDDGTSTVTPNTTTAPDGTTTADTVVISGTSGSGYNYSFVSTVAGTYTLSYYCKKVTADQVGTDTSTVAPLYARYVFSTDTVTKGANAIAAGRDILADGWVRVWVTGVLTTASTVVFRNIVVGTIGQTCYIWGAQLETGSVATRYQRVTTSTDYDTVGFKHYLKCNGTNSGMSTGNINFTGTDKMMVCAGVRKLSDATLGMVIESSSDSVNTNGTIGIFTKNSSFYRYAFGSRGTVAASALTNSSIYDAPVTNVLTATGDISGDRATLRINGVQVAQSTSDQGTGNYGNHPLYIGSRAGTSLFFNGNIYGLIIAGTAATPAQIAAAERIINDDTGAY